MSRLTGLIVLVVGIALLVIGINSSHSVADQVTHTFLGRFTQATTWYILGGVVIGIIGAMMLMAGGGRGRGSSV